MQAINGTTDLYLIPGDPIANVRVPRMFNAVFERFGIDAVMVPTRVAARDLAVFLKASFLAKNLKGMVIAPPHKPLIVSLLDGCGLFGRVAGSVNIVRRLDNGELEGDLFDGEGEVVSALPWGPRVRDIDGVRVCFYREPTPQWELQHRLCRSSNLLSDGSVHASLEDAQSLLFRLPGSPRRSLPVT